MFKKKHIAFLVIYSTAFLGFNQDVTTLLQKAEEKLIENHWEQAFEEFEHILSNYPQSLTYLQQADIYNHLGYLNLMFLDPHEAERNLNRSLTFHEEAGIPNERSYAEALINIGMVYLEQVEFDLAREYVRKGIAILSTKDDWRVDYLISRAKLARIYEEAGSFTLALSIYNESYDQLINLGNDLSPDFADICSHKGRILMQTGSLDEGERFINLSTTIYESLGANYNIQRAESMEDLALFYERMGRYEDAEKTLLEALALKRSIPDEADVLIIETLNDLGILYNLQKRYREAEEMFKEVVKECEENVGRDHHFYATAKNNLGTIALNKGNYSASKILLEDALIRLRDRFGNFHPYYADALNNLARAELKLGNLSRAEHYYMEVLDIDLRLYGDQHPKFATTLLNIGILLSSAKREEEAEEYYESTVAIREKSLGKNHPSFASALEYTGIHYLAVDKLDHAEISFRKALQIQLKQIEALFPIMNEQEQELFYLQIREDVRRYHYVASQLLESTPDLIEHIFDFQAKSKSLLFGSMDKIHGYVANSNDDLLIAEYNQWLMNKKLLASYYQMGVKELIELHINLDLVEAQIEQQEKILNDKIHAFNEAIPNKVLSWQSVMKRTRPDELVVEIIKIEEFKTLPNSNERIFGFTGRCNYLAIMLHSNAEQLEYAFLGSANVSDQVHLTKCQSTIESGENGQEIFESYWQPIMDMCRQSEHIMVVPDGIYCRINPNQFKINKKEYVIDKQYVTYLTSCRDLFHSRPTIHQLKIGAISRPSFKEKKYEHMNKVATPVEHQVPLADLFGDWKINVFEKDDATEYSLRSIYQPTIFHIESPSFFDSKESFIDDKTPLISSLFNSGLYFSGVGDSYTNYANNIPSIPINDGILTVYETTKLDLNRTRLVLLSSVALDRHASSSSEGFYGLLRALTVAGATHVISSLKAIDPKMKKELLVLFYKKFLESDEILFSFRYAQLEMKKKYADINSWGPFIVTGYGL